MKRARDWLIGGAFVVVLVVAATQYHEINDTKKPIGERIDQQAGVSLPGRQEASSDKSTDGARADDNSVKAARLDKPSEDPRTREITGPAAALAPTPEQREKIRGQVAGPRESRVDTSEFTPTLGNIVPLHVLLHRLPAEIADIMGGYHGSDYLIVRDQLVIVDPNARRIVAVVPGV
jgi:uncharacterized protein DUF1236